MKLDHVERPLRGARQEPAVEFGNVFRCEANVKRGPVLRYRDGIDFARKAIVESSTCSARYAALFAAATSAPTTRVLNSSTVMTSAVENARIVNAARWTSAADSAP